VESARAAGRGLLRSTGLSGAPRRLGAERAVGGSSGGLEQLAAESADEPWGIRDLGEVGAGPERGFLQTSDHRGRWGAVTKADPMARASERPPGDASRIPQFEEYSWGDAQWLAGRYSVISGDAPLRIYEVHAPSWRDGVQDWDTLAVQLGAHVRELGFTHVEFLPIAEHPFGGSWGYQISGFYAPTSRLGDPEGMKRCVDHLHGLGIGVILDWVPGHFVRDAWALGRFDGTAFYEHHDPRRGEHPDWGTHMFQSRTP
jgi:1,4-alpha-glucan branching enzyme